MKNGAMAARGRQERNQSSHIGRTKIVDVVAQAGLDFLRDNDTQSAAAVAYYSLLSAFPLMLAILAIASLFIDPRWAVDVTTGLLGPVLPAKMGTVESIVRDAMSKSRAVSCNSQDLV